MSKLPHTLCAVISAWAVAAAAGQANPFTAGSLVVLQAGDGAAALNSAATRIVIAEIRISDGTVLQSVPISDTTSGSNRAVTMSGTATSEGFITRSVSGEYLTFVGYDAPVGTTGIAGTSSATVNRVVARIAADGTIDSSTAFDAYSGSNIRSAVSTDGISIWTGGNGSPASTGGVRFVQFSDFLSIQIAAAPTNTRIVNIFDGQLYCSSASGAFQGVSKVGDGLPTLGGEFITLLPGFPTTTGPSPYDFFFADSQTLYVADDRTLANGGGLQKWTFDTLGGSWSLQYTLNTGLTAGLRGLTGIVDRAGITLYATTGDSVNATNGNKLVKVTDTGSSSEFTVIATAPGNTAWRGVDFAPIAGTGPTCYANCDQSVQVPFLNVADFGCFLGKFAAGDPYANCDESTQEPVLNVADFGCFLGKFAAGCSAP